MVGVTVEQVEEEIVFNGSDPHSTLVTKFWLMSDENFDHAEQFIAEMGYQVQKMRHAWEEVLRLKERQSH